MVSRDVGAMAEATFDLWAHQVGLTPNKARHDLRGWDYLLEWPLPPSSGQDPADRVYAPFVCLVQVKGTDKPQAPRPVRLSNWVHLVRSPLPAFFLVIGFGGGDDPQAAYLVHVGEEWITRTLRRLRELDRRGEPALHRRWQPSSGATTMPCRVSTE